ncbi:TadE/TadG family type IV pilus assembly protein [Oceanicola sp. S124]|uniref:TadE/TadG family type IV pilus assembly protein n=1 Tax=Oceanicola sp. S124 TaxID=1042378 RepID=UPI0002558612|nr:TadE/TadG family type IV pilus assembly protein [Oceanicola sp. S124]
MTRLRTFLREDSGATAVEFALILPVLLAMLFGIICFGQYFAIANSLQQLAAEAARHSVTGLAEDERADLAEAYINEIGARFSFLGAEKVSAEITMLPGTVPAIEIALTYDLAGSAVDVADGFLGLDIPSITRRSYLAY